MPRRIVPFPPGPVFPHVSWSPEGDHRNDKGHSIACILFVQEFLADLNKVNGNDAEVAKFMRKGQTGDWRNHMTEEQVGDYDVY